MIKLITPISHLFTNGSDVTDICNLSDQLEARERTCELELDNTTHYHIDFDLNLGLSKKQLDFLEKHVKNRESIQTLTFQASRDCIASDLQDGMFRLSSKPLAFSEQLLNIKKSISLIKDIVGTSRTIGIENNNYYPTGAYDICTSRKFLSTILEETGLMFLFDMAHAMVTAHNLNEDFKDYSDCLLSSGRCLQLHLCEPSFTYRDGESFSIDAHNLPIPNTTLQAIQISKDFDIPAITVEYYRDACKLSEYLLYLRKILHNDAKL